MADTNQQLLLALTGPAADLEKMFQDLINLRTLDTATGVTLKLLAKLVGQIPGGLDDDTLRRYIRARIASNRSRGSGEDSLAICRLVVNDSGAKFTLHNDGVAAFRIQVEQITFTSGIADDLMTFLSEAVSGGVRVILEWRSFPLGETFRFDVGPGYDVGHYADAEDNT